MTCVCGSERIMHLYGHARDSHDWEIPHLGYDDNGYAPSIPGVCSGDDISFSFCLDCGKIQNFKPISDEYLIEELELVFDDELDDKDPDYDPDLGY